MRSRSLHHSGDWNKFLWQHAEKPASSSQAARGVNLESSEDAEDDTSTGSAGQVAGADFRTYIPQGQVVADAADCRGRLTIWVLYATVRVFMGHWYFVPQYHYLTPFYSPCVSGECVPGSSTLGQWIPAVPPIIPYAFVSLVFVLGFRLTCYYYRGAYYRAFWRAPSACAVREPHATYSGETRFPLIAQNIHRYFWYAALFVGILLTYDVAQAFRGPDGNFGFGIGSLILLANVIFIWGYTLGCHTCRHITAGRLKNFSKHPVRYWAGRRSPG
jgi:hypothetical protein